MQDIIFLIRDARIKHYRHEINSHVQICFRRIMSSMQMLEFLTIAREETFLGDSIIIDFCLCKQ